MTAAGQCCTALATAAAGQMRRGFVFECVFTDSKIREVMVPVRAETPEPRIVEVPVYMEGPTRIIREPPEVQMLSTHGN